MQQLFNPAFARSTGRDIFSLVASLNKRIQLKYTYAIMILARLKSIGFLLAVIDLAAAMFTITAQSGTDMWRKPPSTNVFNGDDKYTPTTEGATANTLVQHRRLRTRRR
jgi:hypothetical protein